MQKLIIPFVLFLNACTVIQEQPIVTPVDPTYAQPLVTALADSQIQASQLNQLMQGIYGPNSVSEAINQYQTANRQLSYLLQSPFEYLVINKTFTKFPSY